MSSEVPSPIPLQPVSSKPVSSSMPIPESMTEQPSSPEISKGSAAVSAAVSVVIPAYNAIQYLPETVNSVLAQTYQDFEVIIVNDGSQDDIEPWYEGLSPEVKRQVTLISQPNQGVSKARNVGIAHSQSPYVAFLDSDDVWVPEKLARQVHYLETNPSVDLVYSRAAMIDSNGQLIGKVFGAQTTAEHHATPAKTWSQLVVSNRISTPSTVLLRRACLVEVGLFDTALSSYVEDKDLWLRIARRHSVQMMPEVLIYKRRHATNLSKKWAEMEQASYQVLEKAFASPPVELNTRQLQQLKQQSYGKANLMLAWKPLQTNEVDIKISVNYLRQALAHCPALIGSKETLKLVCVITAITLLGTQLYRLSLQKIARLRYRLAKS